MGRPAKIWWYADRGAWYATIEGLKVRLGEDRMEAQREFHRLKSIADPVKIGALSTIELVDRYLHEARKTIKPVTWDRYQYALQRWVDSFGAMRAVEIRPFHLLKWLDKHPKWNQSTRALQASIVKAWSAWCRSQGYLELDHLAGTRLPGILKREPAQAGALDVLLKYAKEPEFVDILTVMVDTGCRPGEMRSLEALRCDLARSVAEVRGKTGPRIVGLSQRSVAILARLCARWPHGPVFRAPSGRPWSQLSLWRRFDRTAALAGIEHVVPYHTRHDWWGRAGDLSDVLKARQLGHVSLKELVSRYAHPSASQLAAVSEAASKHGHGKPESAPKPPKDGKHRTRRAPRRG